MYGFEVDYSQFDAVSEAIEDFSEEVDKSSYDFLLIKDSISEEVIDFWYRDEKSKVAISERLGWFPEGKV